MSNRRRLKPIKTPDKKIPVMRLIRNPDRSVDEYIAVQCTCGAWSGWEATAGPLMIWAQTHRDLTGHQLREH